ncbi:MAG: HlyD family secretion protein [Gemmatimonadales bacterium]
MNPFPPSPRADRRLVLALAAALAACATRDDGALVGRGTIEVPEIDLAPSVGARVVRIAVEEGATVAPGDTVALLSQAELPGTLEAYRARVAEAAAAVRDLERGARPEEINRAGAEASAAAAEAERTATELTRFEGLFRNQVISRQQLDNATTAARVAAERKQAADEALALLRAGTRRDRITVAQAELANARAALASVEARASDLVLTAPVAGRIVTRPAEPGEFLGPGIPVVTLGETGRPYVRTFVPAARLAALKVGDLADVTVDGTGQALGQARIVSIGTKAEFTPRVALTEAERADLMFAVKLDLVAPDDRSHAGLWVSVRFAPAEAGSR